MDHDKTDVLALCLFSVFIHFLKTTADNRQLIGKKLFSSQSAELSIIIVLKVKIQ